MTQIEYRFPLVEVRYLVATDHPYHVCFLFATGLRLNASNSPRFNEGSADCGEKSSGGRVVTVQLRENLWLGQNDHAGPQNVSLVDAKPFAQKRKLTFSRVWPGTRVSPNGCGTSTTGSVFSSNRIRRPSNTCNCWKPTLMIRSVTKSSPVKWAGRNCWTRRIGARRLTRSSTKTRTKRAISTWIRQGGQPRRLRSIVCIAPLLP